MKFHKILDLIKYQENCVFCSAPMFLMFRDFHFTNTEDYGLSCKIENDICKIGILKTVIGSLSINLINNSWSTSKYGNTGENIISILNGRRIYIFKKCYACNHNFIIQTLPIKFNTDNKIDPISMNFVKFRHFTNKNNININISNNYINEKTILVHMAQSGEYHIPHIKQYQEFSLIDFDFSSEDKITQKIQTILTFS